MSAGRIAMVLAAGESRRLRPLTDDVAKPALPFVGEPILGRVLDGLAAAGVETAIVNLHHAPDSVRRVVADRGRRAPRVLFSDETRRLLGTAGALIPVRQRLASASTFLLVNGDCVHELDYERLWRDHAASGAAATLAVRPRAEPGFGALRVDEEGWITAFGVRARGAPDERHYLSAQVVQSEVLDILPAEARPLGTFDAWYPAAERRGHRFRVHATEAPWHAADTPERYLAATADWLAAHHAEAFIHPTAHVAADAAVAPDCAVHAGSTIEGGTSLVGSVVLDGGFVGAGARLEACIVGPSARVEPGENLRHVTCARSRRLHHGPMDEA